MLRQTHEICGLISRLPRLPTEPGQRFFQALRQRGQGLPLAINAVCTEIWSASNIAFGLCPLLTLSAIEALEAPSVRTTSSRMKSRASRGSSVALTNAPTR